MADPNELKTFQDLYEELSKPAQQTPEYAEFLQKLNSVNTKMSAMYTPDHYNRIPLVTEADKEELLNLHEELGVAAEKALKNPGGMENATLDTLKKLNGLNNAYRNAMRNYIPSEKKALHTIHEEMRTPVIDTRDTQLKAQIGGAVSKRQPLTFLDPKGNTISGVFIPEKRETGLEDIVDAVNKASQSAKTKNGKRVFKNMMGHFKDLHADEEDQSLYRDVELMVRMAVPGSNPPKFTPESVASYIDQHFDGELRGGSVQDEIGAQTISDLAEALNSNYHRATINLDDAMIEPGSRIDTRNAAMSSVAELLGVPNVIARSKPMQIIDANGNKVNGTFMTEAEGMDPGNLPPEAEKIGVSAGSGTDGKAFKDIADLQVLDYICGNIDRHANNFFMKFNKKGKLEHIQGIDNDCSCGKRIPEKGEGFNRLVGLKDLRVMSESMYNKIKDLTPAQLRFSLRGYGLSEAELNAACMRLKQIQAMAKRDIAYYADKEKKPKAGRLLIVPDNQFKKMKLEDMASYKTFHFHGEEAQMESNLFAMVKGNLTEFKDMYRRQEAERVAENKARETLKSEIAIGSDNRANPGAIEKNAEQAEKLSKEMDKRTNPWKLFWKSSPAYEKMEKATKDYYTYQRKLKERLGLAKDPVYTGKSKNAGRNFDWEAVVSKEDMEKMRDLAKKMYEASNAYCEGKKDLDLETASSYQKKRLEIGKMNREFAKKAMGPLTEKEKQTLDENEKLAKENETRTQGNKKEAEDLKKGGPVA